MKWSELKNGDTLYVVIPINKNNEIVGYNYEETSVISNKNGYLRFKITQNGKRRRIEQAVWKYFDEKECLYLMEGAFFEKPSVGSLIISYEKELLLKNVEEFIKYIKELLEHTENMLKQINGDLHTITSEINKTL